MIRTYKGLITSLLPNQVFTFGSNPEGIHGAGAARVAVIKFGAIMGKGRGHMGQSYGLVTKNLTPNYYEDETKITYVNYGERSLSKDMIIDNIKELYTYANNNLNLEFLIAYTSAPNLNGYTPLEMAEMFLSTEAPNNIIFNEELIKLYYEHKERT